MTYETKITTTFYKRTGLINEQLATQLDITDPENWIFYITTEIDSIKELITVEYIMAENKSTNTVKKIIPSIATFTPIFDDMDSSEEYLSTEILENEFTVHTKLVVEE